MGGPALWRIAWRNLWRNKRRTGLTLLAIGFGGGLAVLVTAMTDKSFADFIDTAARLGGGHVTIQDPAYLDSPTFAHALPAADRVMTVAERDASVSRVVARVTGQAMAATAWASQGVGFIAYDPAREDSSTFTVLAAPIRGSWLTADDARGAVLGSRLAATLDVAVGDKLVLTTTDARGEIVSTLARVRGIMTTGTPSIDAGLCLLTLSGARQLLGYGPGQATLVAVFLRDARAAPAAAHRLGRTLGPGTAALTWDQVRPDLRAFIAIKIGGSRFMELLVMLLVAAGIFNTLFVAVTERMREFGILLAIGYQPHQIFRLVLWESLWLGLVGVAAGALLIAWPYARLHHGGLDLSFMTGGASAEVSGVGFNPIIHIAILPEHLVFIVLAVLLTTLAAGLYPAWRAGRVDPVHTIKLV